MKRVRLILLFLIVVGLPGIARGQVATEPGRVRVTFQLNDSMVKDKVLAGVGVGIAASETGDFLIKGETDAAGKFETDLASGTWFVSYRKAGYIPLACSPVIVEGDQPRTFTVTLTMMLEEAGLPVQKRRVQIVLNWGTGRDKVRDADSHLVCVCPGDDSHVSFSHREHQGDEHRADLDVDDTDWGGPETITLMDPPPGKYRYWVHNFSGPEARLADSEVVVRVVFGDRMAGEFRPPPGSLSRVWSPFRAIEIDTMLDPRIVPFTPEELAAQAPFDPQPEQAAGLETSEPIPAGSGGWIPIGLLVLVFFLIRRYRRARAG